MSDRTPGRRLAARRAPSWPALLAVLVTAAAIVLAGRAGLPAPATVDPAGAPVSVDRVQACPSGLPGGRVEKGVAGQAVAGSPLAQTPGAPVRVVTPADQSRGAFATQVASGPAWLAATPCPQPRAEWWFVGVGGSGQHGSTVLLANPRSGDAVVDVEVLGPNGPVQAPGLRGLPVPAGTTTSLDLSRYAPSTGDLAVHVTTSRGLVAASATDSFSPTVVADPLREWVTPQPAAAERLVLTGLPGKPTDATLLVANPSDVEVLAQLSGIGAKATFTPDKDATLRVPPGSVAGVPVTALFDGSPLAVQVKADKPLVASVRATASGDVTYAGAAGQPADGATLGVPQGVRGEVRISSLGPAGAATVTAYDGAGKPLVEKRVDVAAGTTSGLALPDGTRAVRLTDTATGLVAGLVLTRDKGVASAVFETAVQAARTPEVRPAE